MSIGDFSPNFALEIYRKYGSDRRKDDYSSSVEGGFTVTNNVLMY